MPTIAELTIKVNTSDLDRANRALDQLSKKTPNTGKSVEGLADDFTKLQEEIDPTVKALNRLQQQQERLQTAFAKGGVDTQEYSRLNGIIESSRKRINDLGQTTGKTAKEINFALRGLPAQFTDIFVSLQGGQAPLTVFLQQGGQIKDMFGGVGPAFRAMGGYILGLINPLTIGAAAIGTFAAGMYLGGKEAQNFNKAIQETGNESGTSVANLNSLASSLGNVVGTTGKAAKTLTEVASAGNIASTSFETVAKAAIAWEKATGTATEETIAKFSEINKDPVKAIEELNDKMNFLTADVYKQILAFEDQGDAASAASLAEFEYARALEERSTKITDNLGIVEKAWAGVAGAAKRGWDAILDIGRQETFEDRLDKISSQIELARKKTVSRWQEETGQIFSEASLDKQWEAEWQKEQDRAQGEWAQILADANERRKVSLLKTTNDLIDSARTNKEKLEQELKKYNEEVAASAGTIPEADAEKARAAIRKKYEGKKDLKPAKEEKVREDAGTRLLAVFKQQEAALISQRDSVQKLATEETKYVKLQEQIKQIEQKSLTEKLTKEQQSLLANKDALLAQQQRNVEIQKEIVAKKELANLDNLRASLAAKLEADQRKYEDQALGAGMSDKQVERMRERLQLQREYNSELEKLTRDRNRGDISQESFEAGTRAIKESLNERTAALESSYKRMDQIQSDWSVGASKAWENYLEQGRDVADLTASFFTNSISSMEDAIVSFVTTGKLSFKDLTVSILSDLARMATRIAANQILMSIIGTGMSLFGGAAGAGGGGASASDYTGSAYSNWVATQADGGAWSGGVQMFAKGGAFTNSIVNSPTAFGMQGGMGVMGEAGPEAIMPLTRTSDGQLGVKAASGGSSVLAPVGVTVNITDSGAGTNSSGNTNTETQGRAVQMAIKSEVERAIQVGMQPGGQIWRSLNNR